MSIKIECASLEELREVMKRERCGFPVGYKAHCHRKAGHRGRCSGPSWRAALRQGYKRFFRTFLRATKQPNPLLAAFAKETR